MPQMLVWYPWRIVATSAANARRPKPAASAPAPDAARNRLRFILSTRTIMISSFSRLCAAFVAASGFRCVLAQVPQEELLVLKEIHAERVAGTRQPDRHDRLDAARVRRHDYDAVGEVDGLGHVVGHVDDRL